VAVLTPPFETQRLKGAASFLLTAAAVIALLYFGQPFFVTLIISGVVAFILEPAVALLMRIRLPRAVASFLVCVVALLVVYLTALGFYTQFAGFYADLPAYSTRISELVEIASGRLEAMEQSISRLVVPKREREREQAEAQARAAQAAQAAQAQAQSQRRRRSSEAAPAPALPPAIQEVRILPERTGLWDYIYDHLGSVYKIALMASFVPFLVYFMLSWREHLYRAFLQLFEGQGRLVAGKSLEGIASMVRAYVAGNFALGLLLAGASSLFFWFFRLPYPLLVGPMSGFLSLVPYIGLPLAMIPPLFAALPIYHTMPPYLIVGTTVGVLHLLALNLLYPKIVGSRVHLNPLVVTVALMLWGVLWGAVGLILAIPLTAAIKAVCDNVSKLQPYGRLLGD
jgi:predicted PurR-regulated permease PerM